MKQTLVIVGASYAGIQLAATAREFGFDGHIVLTGDEPDAPYHRPPLSKGFLTGSYAEDRLPLRSQAFIDYFCKLKEAELARFNLEVTEWEHREYFETF